MHKQTRALGRERVGECWPVNDHTRRNAPTKNFRQLSSGAGTYTNTALARGTQRRHTGHFGWCVQSLAWDSEAIEVGGEVGGEDIGGGNTHEHGVRDATDSIYATVRTPVTSRVVRVQIALSSDHELHCWARPDCPHTATMALSAMRRPLGKRVDVQLPIVGYGGAGVMLGGKQPATERAAIGKICC